MAKYKLLIIDDEWDKRQNAYRTVLEDGELFDLVFLQQPKNLGDIEAISPDGYIVDIFLSENGWHTKASEILDKYISKNRKPVFLVTERLNREEIKDEINNLLKHPVTISHFFPWSEFANTRNEIERNANAATTRWKIQIELDTWHQRSRFSPSPSETLRILQISDLQFKDPGTSVKSFLVEYAIANSLRNDGKLPDFLIINGDIAYSGRPGEYFSALSWFDKEFLPQMKGEDIDQWRERILIVPGNHDVNLRFCSCDYYDYNFSSTNKKDKLIRSKSKYADHQAFGLNPFREFAYRLSPDKNWLEKDNLCWVSNRYIKLGIQFILLNSVLSINSDNPSEVIIENDTLGSLSREIHDLEMDRKPFRILISHHGPQSKEPSIKAIKNWQQVENFIETSEIDLFVHGHGHGYEVNSMGGTTSRRHIPIVMAPTTHLAGKLRSEDQLRGFNLIELHRKNSQVVASIIHHYEIRGASAKIRDSSDAFRRIK